MGTALREYASYENVTTSPTCNGLFVVWPVAEAGIVVWPSMEGVAGCDNVVDWTRNAGTVKIKPVGLKI